MRKRLVGLGHFMGIFFLLYCGTLDVGGGDDLIGKVLVHRPSFASASGIPNPAHGKRKPSFRPYHSRYLIIGVSDTLGPYFGSRTGIPERQIKNFKRVRVAGFFFDNVKSSIHYLSGGFFLP